MQYEILYQPSYAVARILLELGDTIRAESGAMVSMSPSVELQSQATGGIGKMFGRLLGGESLFQSTFTARHGAGEVILAPPGPGDIVALNMAGESMIVTSGCYLAGDVSLEMSTMANLRGFFSGEGVFMLRIAGVGPLLLSSFGAIHELMLPDGHSYIVDSGHIVAFSDGMRYDIRKAARGIWGSITSGEGIVVELTGPGRLYVQTRTPYGFGSWLGGFIPRSG